MKEKGELLSIREAQKRLSWIDNVKRIMGYDQEKAESEWAKIHTTKQQEQKQRHEDRDGAAIPL